MCYGIEGEAEQVRGIAKLEWFARDPSMGTKGLCLRPESARDRSSILVQQKC